MAVSKFSQFQVVLEAILEARARGSEVVASDMTSRTTDDPDCYPRGLLVALEKTDPKLVSLRFLAKHLDWVSFSSNHLYLKPLTEFRFRLTEVGYLHALAECLTERGIPCSPDVNWQ